MSNSYTKQLPIKIGEAERDAKAREAALLRHQAKKKADDLRLITEPVKKSIKELEDQAIRLEEASATGELLADVEVREEKDFTRNEVRLVRLDTGETIEGPRAMTGKERQIAIVDDGGDGEKEAEPGAKKKKGGGKKHAVKLPPPGSQNN